MKTLKALMFVAVLAASTATGATSPESKVISVEAAMRTWQERRAVVALPPVRWPARSDGVPAADFPEDCFYGDDLSSPILAASLVEALRADMVASEAGFVRSGDFTDLDEIRRIGPALQEIPAAGRENYVAVFSRLVAVLAEYPHVLVTSEKLSRGPDFKTGFAQFQPGTISHLEWDAAVSLALLQYEGNRRVLDEGELPGGDGTLGTNLTLLPDVAGNPNTLFFGTTFGRFSLNTARYSGKGTLFVRQTRTAFSLGAPGGPPLPPAPPEVTTLTEPIAVGPGVWRSRVHGYDGMPPNISYAPGFLNVRSVPHAVITPAYQHKVTELFRECDSCRACDGCAAGTAEFHVRSVDVHFALGSGPDGSAGEISIKAHAPGPELATPTALSVETRAGARALYEATPGLERLRQVITPGGIVDIVGIDDYSYEVRFHAEPARPSSTGGEPAVPAVAPYQTYRVENPARSAGRYDRLRITAFGERTGTALYEFDEATKSWTMHREEDGIEWQESRRSAPGETADIRIEDHSIRDGAGAVLRHERNTYRRFPWNEPGTGLEETLVESVVDPTGHALRTTFEYYSDVPAGHPNYGRLRRRTNPAGFWQEYGYDGEGRVTAMTSPFLNAAPGSSTGVRTTELIRQAAPPQETRIESVIDADGNRRETGRRFTVIEADRRVSIEATVAGSGWDDPRNLVTTTRYVTDGDYRGRVALEVRPDGTATAYHYSSGPDGSQTTVTETGAFHAQSSTITDGDRTVVVRGPTGTELRRSLADIRTGIALESSEAAAFDEQGRATRIRFDDGTIEDRTFSCCGVVTFDDREGVRTDYAYAARQVVAERRAGVEMRYLHDALGRRTQVSRVGADATEIVLERVSHDSAGRVSSTETGLGRTRIAYSSEPDGTSVVTTTYPDGGTRIERKARDGSLLSVAGTAVAPVEYERGVDARGLFMTAIRIGSAAERTEWLRTYFDHAGRESGRVYPEGATESMTYNEKGQVVEATDADGVVRLFAYNPRGERELTAIDMNGNGLIDFAGSDRITRVARDVVAEGGRAFRRTVESVWATVGVNAETVSRVELTSARGRETRRTAHGMTTLAQTDFPGAGVRVETGTSPDGTVSVQRFLSGRLVDNTVSHPAGGILSSSRYEYDAHGRLERAIDLRDRATVFAYGPGDTVLSVTGPDAAPSRGEPGPEAHTTWFTYDSNGRLTRTTLSDGSFTLNEFYPTGALRKVSGSRINPEVYEYDAQGRVIALTTWRDVASNSGAVETRWEYDSVRGWLNTKATDGKSPVRYTYLPSGRVHTRTLGRGVSSTFAYNRAGETVAIDYGDQTPDVAIEHDRLGRIAAVRDAAGVAALEYGDAGVVRSERYSGEGHLSGLWVAREHDPFGRVERLEHAFGAPLTLAYDDHSRLSRISRGNTTASFEYGGGSLLARQAILHGGVEAARFSRTYDSLDRLSGLTAEIPGATSSGWTVHRDAVGQRRRTANTDGSQWDYDYDSIGQLSRARKHLPDGEVVDGLDLAYSYDGSGNRTHSVRGASGSTGAADGEFIVESGHAYAHRTVPGKVDIAGTALLHAKISVGAVTARRQGERFFASAAYDNTFHPVNAAIDVHAVGAGMAPDGEDIAASARASAFLPRSPEVFEYDADGNLVTDGRWRYSWDAENRLIRIETRMDVSEQLPSLARHRLEFAYDNQDRRVRKAVYRWDQAGARWTAESDLRFLYDGSSLIAEIEVLSGLPVLVRSYAWGPDEDGSLSGAGGAGSAVFADLGNGEGMLRTGLFVTDTAGNVVRVIAADSGVTLAEYEFDPFGNRLQLTGSVENPLQFSSQYADKETGLVYYGSRYYSPVLGRWISPDPLGESETTNPYRFVSNNPTNRRDILGLYEEAGHFWTSYVVAEAAGMSPDEAFRFAYFSQLPDEAIQFDAVNAGLGSGGAGLTGGKRATKQYLEGQSFTEFNRRIQEMLHSLHGGKRGKIDVRRACLNRMLSSPGLEPWEAGFINHAYGDSFAHTRDEPGEGESAYGFPVGHFLDTARDADPDSIAINPGKYRKYVLGLFSALSRGAGDQSKISRLLGVSTRIPRDNASANRFMMRWVSANSNYSKSVYRRYNPNGERNVRTDPELLAPTANQLDNLFRKMSASCCEN